MLAMKSCLLAAVLLACTPAFAAQAQGQFVERQVSAASGHDVRFGIYADIGPDCTSGPLPAIKLVAAPMHGTVTVKRGTLKATNLKQCLAAEVPVFVGFYRSTVDFAGSDEFELEITYPGGRKEMQRVHVSVSGNSSTERHI
jgi:hypothetical protein